MNKFIKISFSAIMFTVAVLTIASSCKKQFDAPPADVAAAKLTPNYTIAQLKAKHTVSGNIERIDSSSDIIIRAIVIADDKSGNYYKTLVIQDSTGGLALLVNGSSLYNTFPIGREVFIKCNGLYLGDYNNQIQMGGGIQTGSTSSLADIPSAILEKNVFKGTLNNVVVPKDVLPAQLTTTMQDKYQNTLIRLTNVEFDWHDTTKTFASAGITSPSAASFNLKYCASLSSPNSDPGIVLRTSNYANFASTPLPTGNGTIVAIYSVYTRYKQLAIRDASDVQFNSTRCGNSVVPPPTGTVLLTENFDGQTVPTAAPFNAVAVTGWFNGPELGNKKFDARAFSGNKYAQLSAFGSTQANVTTWLVTSGINLGTYPTKTLTFGTSGGYANGATLKVLVSSNYTGTGNPWAAGVTWTDLTSSATLATIPASGYASGFTPSGNISLNSYSGTVYVAFKYEGADPAGTASDKTTTWQIDNILVTGN